MYCHQCGTALDSGAKFCHRCGTRVAEPDVVGSRALAPTGSSASEVATAPELAAPPPRTAPRSPEPPTGPREVTVRMPDFAIQPAQLAKTGRWRGVSGSGGLVMLIAFVLPWVSVSCDPRTLGVSPQNLPTWRFSGFDLATGPRIDTPFGTQQAAGSPILWLAPIAALVVIGCILFVKNHRLAAVSALVAALASLVPMIAAWQSFESQRGTFTRVSIEYGLWLSLLGVILGAVGGLVGLSSAPSDKVESPYGGQPTYAQRPDPGELRT